MKRINVEKGLCIISVLMLASVCFAGSGGFESGPWKISKGAENVLIFEPEYIPSSTYYYAFTVVGHSDKIIVSGGRQNNRYGPRESWQPKGRPLGMYVYVLNLTSKTVSLMAWEDFKRQEIMTEFFHSKMVSAYPDLNYQGKPIDYFDVIPFEKDGRELVLAPSFVNNAKEKKTFGIPSIIPFMGRQKWVERETYHSGTVFVEVFDKMHPTKPLVQFQRNYKKLTILPQVRDMACWTQGTEQPILVVVESSFKIKKQKGRIFLVKLPSTDSE